jgi:type IV pilus assembly protein PilX
MQGISHFRPECDTRRARHRQLGFVTRTRAAQRGVALFVVIVFVMLSMLLALWASRTALFGEMVVGNDADYQRAFEAAQALMQDAELDIRGENADGTKCRPNTSDDKVCRRNLTAIDQIPLEGADVSKLLADLDALNAPNPKCRHGLCVKRSGQQDFWNNSDPARGVTLAQMRGNNGSSASAVTVGARYGMFTGAQLGSTSNPANPILATRTPADQGGWYWIEVMPYDESAKTSGLIVGSGGASVNDYLALNVVPNVVYRITALAQGMKPGSTVVLQQTYVRQKLKD